MNRSGDVLLGAARVLVIMAVGCLASCSSHAEVSTLPTETLSTATETPVTPTDTATPSPSPTLTATHSPTVDLTPSLTATPRLTSTPRPTRTPTPTATYRPTPTPGPIAETIWYADGDITVYTRNRNLCALRRGEETPIYLADATWLEDVQVSSDGEYVAFVRIRPREGCRGCSLDELWVVRHDGADVHLLLTVDDIAADIGLPYDEFLRILQWVWIPHTHLIALTTGGVSHGVTYNNDLQLVDTDTITRHYLFSRDEGGGAFFPSPDGRQIAVVTSDSISLVNIDGTNWRPNIFSYDTILTWSENTVFAWPVWTLDSAGFWVAIPPPGGLHSRHVTTMWYVSATNSEIFHLADIEFEWRGYGRENTVFSPDGSYIALIPEYSGTDLTVFDADGSEEIGHYSLGEYMGFVRWEPDSEHFIVWVDEHYNFQRVGLDGTIEPLYAHNGEPVRSLPVCIPDSD